MGDEDSKTTATDLTRGGTTGVFAVSVCHDTSHTADCQALRKTITARALAGQPYDARQADGSNGRICNLMLSELVRTAAQQNLASVHLRNAEITRGLDLELAICRSLVLSECDVKGDLKLGQASADAITLEKTSVRGSILARELSCSMGISFLDANVDGSIDVTNAEVDGDFDCSGTKILGFGRLDAGLNADGMKCEGSFMIKARGERAFDARYGVRLVGSRIEGTLDARGAHLETKSGAKRERLTVPRARTVPASSDAEKLPDWREPLLTLESSSSENAALCADLLRCEGSVLLDGVTAKGDVRFLAAQVAGQLLARKVRVVGSIRCNAMACKDVVIFEDVEFPSDVGGWGMAFSGARIDGRLELRNSRLGWLGLYGARVGNFVDDENSRPPRGQLAIDGFTYELISDSSFQTDGIERKEFDARLAWLERQTAAPPQPRFFERVRTGVREWLRGSDHPYVPGPYTIFADFLDRRGRPTLATDVKVRREALRARQKGFGKRRTLWALISAMVGYGYKPHLALQWIAVAPIVYNLIALAKDDLRISLKATLFANLASGAKAYLEAADAILPLPAKLAHADWPVVVVGSMTLVLSSVGGAGLLRMLGSK